ncbi:unnamed protein product, partial [Nesidiocoris tenuis]
SNTAKISLRRKQENSSQSDFHQPSRRSERRKACPRTQLSDGIVIFCLLRS